MRHISLYDSEELVCLVGKVRRASFHQYHVNVSQTSGRAGGFVRPIRWYSRTFCLRQRSTISNDKSGSRESICSILTSFDESGGGKRGEGAAAVCTGMVSRRGTGAQDLPTTGVDKRVRLFRWRPEARYLWAWSQSG